jgi:hypothetical protein
MKIHLSDLWRLDGTIDRRPYFVLGVSLSLLKMYFDYLIAARLFGRTWTPVDYAVPSEVAGLFSMSPADRWFFRTMLLMALPFLTCGVALTVRRLKSAGLPRYAVVLFFAPIPLNLLFYLLLSVLPARPSKELAAPIDDEWDPIAPPKQPGSLDRLMPEGRTMGALAAIFVPLPFAMLFTVFSVSVLGNYGWGLFVGIPFALPMISVILYGYRKPRRIWECLGLGMLWLGVAYGMLLLWAYEGMVCLVMALPLAIPVVLLGSAVGYSIQARPLRSADASRIVVILLAGLPTMIGAESATHPDAPLFAVSTAVEVDAPADRVWAHVIRFEPLPVPRDWVFHTGIAYPMRAEIQGHGVGAVRRCEFSTGPFIEPIEVWDEPRLLRFAVTSNPPSMQEWNPFAEIHPPHLDDALVAHRGEFRLTGMPGGRTLLEGTTWYRNHMWPTAYWRLWSDSIIHQIHRTVLEHIRHSAEAESRRTSSARG